MKGMRVALLAGDVSWIYPGNRGFTETLRRFAEYQKSASPDERFYALHLDVEPHQDAKLSDARKWQLYRRFPSRRSVGDGIRFDRERAECGADRRKNGGDGRVRRRSRRQGARQSDGRLLRPQPSCRAGLRQLRPWRQVYVFRMVQRFVAGRLEPSGVAQGRLGAARSAPTAGGTSRATVIRAGSISIA